MHVWCVSLNQSFIQKEHREYMLNIGKNVRKKLETLLRETKENTENTENTECWKIGKIEASIRHYVSSARFGVPAACQCSERHR